jgi:hypothetical protein
MTSPSDIMRNTIYSVLNNVHTSLPGIVKSYDPTTNKATIQPALNKKFMSGPMPMPILENVPIMFPGGVNFNITFPVKEGDYVLLIFIERSIDLWLSVGGQVTPDDPRKFDLSDAVAIPGLQPFTGDFSERNNTDFVINFAGSSITIKENGSIEIKTGNTVAIGNATVELIDVVSQILGMLGSAIPFTDPNVPNTPYSGPFNFAGTANTLKGQLDAIKGTIT